MKSVLLLAAALAFAGALVPDPFEQAVDKMSGPTWKNGISPRLDLPKTASTEELVAKVLAGRKYKILETRKVWIEGGGPGSDTYTAILVETGSQKQVVLLQFDGSWWSHVVDVS